MHSRLLNVNENLEAIRVLRRCWQVPGVQGEGVQHLSCLRRTRLWTG